jgi:hypothetical protein
VLPEWDAEDFLDLVWGERQGWVDIPAKVNQYWIPFHLHWPADEVVTRRIDSSLRDGENLYYSVAQFKRRGRNIEDTMSSKWLWADLDEVHPSAATALGVLPTVAIESSPGRYQALWELDRWCSPAVTEKLNRGLTYALDADKGGWDLTQVLRLPGTRNFKYPDAPMVKVMWLHEDDPYDPREVWQIVKRAVPATELEGATSVVLPRRPLPRRARTLLRTPSDQVVEGERSARLWELECMLVEAGLTAEEIFGLVWPCAWNKWKGIASGDRRLKQDIRKALSHVSRKKALGAKESVEQSTDERPQGTGEDHDDAGPDDESQEEPHERLPFIGYGSFMAMVMEDPKWLIEDIWTAQSHGIIGGEPKTNKTTIALALALSVASGQAFLGQHPVGVQGPVLMVQEENAPWMMQDRLRKIAAYYGLISKKEAHFRESSVGALGSTSLELDFPVDVPLKLLNNYGFDLAVEEHREMLEAEISEAKPVLVILDPLYLILGGADQNHVKELVPFLKWLLGIRNEHGCAIALIHHFRKEGQGGSVVRPGQRLMGNAIFHGWVDSALYMSALPEEREGWVRVGIEKEFRSMAPQKSMQMGITMGDPGSLEMSVELESHGVEDKILDIVLEEPGVTVNQISELLGLDKRTILARVRGGTSGIEVKTGKKGRGRSHQLYPAGSGDDASKNGAAQG